MTEHTNACDAPTGPCLLAAEMKTLRAQLAALKTAALADIRGAGPVTGPIYHREIRKALGLPADGDGRDVVPW